MPQSKRRTEAEALEDVSARMLQGWTMLGDGCPVADCNTPLVRSRQGEVWCARCGAAVVREGAPLQMSGPPPSTKVAAAKARAAWAEAAAGQADDAGATAARPTPEWASTAAEADGEDVDVADIVAHKPRSSKARDAASAAIGQKMLSGWTLLQEACGRKGCVGVPLMRQGADQRRFCVACDTYEDEALDEAVEEAGEEDWRRFVQDEEKQSAEDPLAKPVSEHLLKGYVLLGKQCPLSSCPSPLMRAPDGAEVCVQPACVAAAMLDDDDDDDGDDRPAARNEDRSWLPPPVPGAAALGAHLIRGWGMMEDICANWGCNSPLMRSPAGVVGCVQPECGGAGDGTKRAAAAPQHQAKRAVPTSRHRPPPAFLAARFAPEPADDVFGAAAAACLGALRDQGRGLAAVRAGEVAAAAGALGACAKALASMHGDARAAAAEARAAVRERVGEATAALGAASGFGETRAAAEALEALAVADQALAALL